MQRYQIKIEYDGNKYVGWQYQKNGLSIQEILEKAIYKYLNEKIKVVGAGRTDAKVHAIEQSAHIDIKKKIKKDSFISGVNYFIGNHNVSILDLKKRKKNFHARHSAKRRTYHYLIINRRSSLALHKNRAWFVKKKLNTILMKKSLKLLIGTHDFSTFRAASCEAKSPIKTLEKAELVKKRDTIKIIFSSKSFLQQQVRSMVGSIKYVGQKKWTITEFKKKFKSKKRFNCAPPAPASGLYLKKVLY